MKIGIAGPISSENIARFLGRDAADLPQGYAGAPFLGTLISALLERGHSITAYTTSADLPLSEAVTASRDRFKITFCPARKRAFRFSDGHWGRAADAFKHERTALRQAMQEDEPDLLHAHWSYEFALAAIESGLPHLVTCHDAPQSVLRYSPNLYRLVRYFMARKVLDRAQNLTAVSPYLKQKLKGYARAPLTIVPNPLPQHPPHLAKTNRNYDPARPRIAMVLNGWGALKNPQPALRAFAALRRRIPAAELSIIGIGYGMGGDAETWAKSQGLAAGVHFLGSQPYLAVLNKLAETDLLVHPSLEESFGMSIAEAMSLGVPVVGGHKSGAVPWVIGEGGCVVDVRSADAISQGMMEILKDVGKQKTFCHQARATALARFSPGSVAASYEQAYVSVLQR